MADFKKAWAKTSKVEAGYTNLSADAGKETYRGITYANFPKWDGWFIIWNTIAVLGIKSTIDASANTYERITNALSSVVGLSERVDALYKVHFWDALNLDAHESQTVAEKVFDIAVNMGVITAKNFMRDMNSNV